MTCLIANCHQESRGVSVSKEPDDLGRYRREVINDLKDPFRLKADGRYIDTAEDGGYAAPWMTDLDGDGDDDLVVGNYMGQFKVYRNTGSRTEPVFKSDGHILAGGQPAQVGVT